MIVNILKKRVAMRPGLPPNKRQRLAKHIEFNELAQKGDSTKLKSFFRLETTELNELLVSYKSLSTVRTGNLKGFTFFHLVAGLKNINAVFIAYFPKP